MKFVYTPFACFRLGHDGAACARSIQCEAYELSQKPNKTFIEELLTTIFRYVFHNSIFFGSPLELEHLDIIGNYYVSWSSMAAIANNLDVDSRTAGSINGWCHDHVCNCLSYGSLTSEQVEICYREVAKYVSLTFPRIYSHCNSRLLVKISRFFGI